MSSISPTNFFKPYSPGKGGCRPGSQLVKTSTAQDIQTDLTITTQDGDMVTLKSVVGRCLAIDNEKKEIIEGSKNYINFSIKGDLNEQELKDVNSILDTLEKSMRNLIDGNLEEIVAAEDLNTDEIGTIKSVSGTLQQIEISKGPLSEKELQNSFKMAGNIFREHFDKIGNDLVGSVKDTPLQPEKLVGPVNKLIIEAFSDRHQAFIDHHINLIKEIHSGLLEKLNSTSESLPHIVNVTA